MEERYLIIADDFTGANDTGVQLKRRGYPTEVLFAGKPVGIGIGTVCAVMLVGRVIALFHHIFGKAMLQASGLESGRN